MKKQTKRRLKVSAAVVAAAGAVAIAVALMLIVPHRTVPVLMYHGFTEDESATSTLVIELEDFERQMTYLADNHFNVISASGLADYLANGKELPPKTIVLTFDDGYKSFFDLAYPVLQKHGFPATAYLFIDGLARPDDLDRAKGISAEGLVEIGSHGVTHRMLPLLDPDEIAWELVSSKQQLEAEFGVPVETFCYPAGAITEAIVTATAAAGYTAAVATAYQRGQFPRGNRYIQRRVLVSPVAGCPRVFRIMTSGYYVPARELTLKILGIRVPRDLYRKIEHHEQASADIHR
ncbi:MAG: polysaccharide deacetylase family protein [Lentisphaeria bacterium]|jgi:peptidoglycan/xylan/chitin deacetylase (PgdA/CDA1 family)|nr:polysaccharide deacetylase family protein [Lentisphaeria bacterium]